MDWEIRQIIPQDIQMLIPLCREYAAYEGVRYEENEQADGSAKAFFGSPPVLYGWVVEKDRELIGYITATRDYATWVADFFIHMDCLFLREVYRENGLGDDCFTRSRFLQKNKVAH